MFPEWCDGGDSALLARCPDCPVCLSLCTSYISLLTTTSGAPWLCGCHWGSPGGGSNPTSLLQSPQLKDRCECLVKTSGGGSHYLDLPGDSYSFTVALSLFLSQFLSATRWRPGVGGGRDITPTPCLAPAMSKFAGGFTPDRLLGIVYTLSPVILSSIQ